MLSNKLTRSICVVKTTSPNLSLVKSLAHSPLFGNSLVALFGYLSMYFLAKSSYLFFMLLRSEPSAAFYCILHSTSEWLLRLSKQSYFFQTYCFDSRISQTAALRMRSYVFPELQFRFRVNAFCIKIRPVPCEQVEPNKHPSGPKFVQSRVNGVLCFMRYKMSEAAKFIYIQVHSRRSFQNIDVV